MITLQIRGGSRYCQRVVHSYATWSYFFPQVSIATVILWHWDYSCIAHPYARAVWAVPSGFTAYIRSTVTALATASVGHLLLFLWSLTASQLQLLSNTRWALVRDAKMLMPVPTWHLMSSFCYRVQNFTQPFTPHLCFYTHTAVKIASVPHQRDVNSYEFITFTESFLDKGN